MKNEGLVAHHYVLFQNSAVGNSTENKNLKKHLNEQKKVV